MPPAPNRPPWASSLFALLLCAAAYLYVFPYQANLNNPNENVRLYMTAALVEEGRYEIDGMRKRWGWVNDAAKRDGHLYSVKAPGTSFLGVPAYALYHRLSGDQFDRIEALWWCRSSATILPTLLWLLWLHRWLGRRTAQPALRDCVFYSVALGSLLYGYGMLFVSHTMSAVAAFGCFMLLFDQAERDRPAGPLLGLCAGLLAAATTLFEYPGLVASVVLSVYALWVLRRPRPIAGFVVGGLIPTAAMMHFQWKAFGSPLSPGHLYVETAALRSAHEEGIYGAVGPSAEALYGLTIDPGAGLFPLTPILVFALPGAALMLRDRRGRAPALCALALCLLTLLAISSMNNWRGGWTIGPRYLAVCVPFLAWLALVGLERVSETLGRPALALALGCLGVSLVASGSVSAYYPHLPPEFTRPLPQLISLLVDHDFAPANGLNLLGTYGTRSMLPLAAVALMVMLVSAGSGPLVGRLRVFAMGLAVALLLSLPLFPVPDDAPSVSGARAFVTRRWWPEGHDATAVLRARVKQAGRVSDQELRELARLYAQEGRTKEARRARAGKL